MLEEELVGCIVTILLVAIVATALIFFGHVQTKNGEKIGYITKVTREGIICKTYEAQLVRGGLNNGSGVLGGNFDFTVEKQDQAKELVAAMEDNKQIKLRFHKRLWAPCDSGSDAYFLESFEVIK